MTQLYELAVGFNLREAAASAFAGMGAALRNMLRKVRPPVQRLWTRMVAIVGLTKDAGRVLQKLHEQRNGSVSLLGVFDDRAGRRPESLPWMKIGGRIDDLVECVRAHSADMIILALPPSATSRINEILARLRSLPVDIVVTADEANA